MYCIKNLFLEKTIDKRLTDWYNSVHNEKAELCNGSTTDSDSVCWGSNPYSAAKKETANFKRNLLFPFLFSLSKKRVFAVEKMDKMNIFSRFCKSLTKPTNHATLHIKNKQHEYLH